MIFNTFPRSLPEIGSNHISRIQQGFLIDTVPGAATDVFNVTINKVDLTRSVVFCVTGNSEAAFANSTAYRASFVSSTQIELRRNTSSNSDIKIAWTVIEFSFCKPVQSGTTTMLSGNASTVVPISTVKPEKCLVYASYYCNDVSTNTYAPLSFGAVLQDANNLAFTQITVAGTKFVQWYIIELI